jgi:CRISPR-associated protein Csb2
MPTALQLRFPGRRYHATPWGHHVNEGQVEWPPSPWRLLRALVSSGFTRLGWSPERPPAEAVALLEALAAAPPSYRLPPASLAHTRHYVDAANVRALIFDTWAQVDGGALEVWWPVELPPAQRDLLAALIHALGYLGRAESWVEGRLLPEGARPGRGAACAPVEAGRCPPGHEEVRLLAAVDAAAYAAWRGSLVAPIEAEHAAPSGKKRTKGQEGKRAKALAPYPDDLVAALCAETSDLQAQGWAMPPGSRWQSWARPLGALEVGAPTLARAHAGAAVPFALLALATPSRGTSALPPLHRAFPQGRLLHRALASVVGKQLGGDPDLARQLLGRGPDGAPVDGPHGHAHLLHLDLTGAGRLDHALVWAPGGLSPGAVAALRRVRRTFMKGGVGELQVALVGAGEAADLRRVGGGLGAPLDAVLGPPGGARAWVSATPWIAPRHLKPRGRNSLEGQVAAECEARGLPAPVEVQALPPSADRARGLRHAILHDDRHEPIAALRWCLRLRFDRPVEGPICLGYGAHAGLGRFEAEG